MKASSAFLVLAALQICACRKTDALAPCTSDFNPVEIPPPPALPHSERMYIGRIDIAFTVDPAGKVSNPRIVSSDLHFQGGETLPQSQYDKVLLASLREATFPKSKNGCTKTTSIRIN